MSKLKKLKEAIRNPPPERLARIEYRSHALQGIGILFVSVMLIIKGFWYIIFALIFGVGISYSQGIAAYQRYKLIMTFKDEPTIENEISPSRKRHMIIKKIFGRKALWIINVISVIFAVSIIDPGSRNIWWKLGFIPFLLMVWIVLYYQITYKIAMVFYNKKGKGGDDGEKKE